MIYLFREKACFSINTDVCTHTDDGSSDRKCSRKRSFSAIDNSYPHCKINQKEEEERCQSKTEFDNQHRNFFFFLFFIIFLLCLHHHRTGVKVCCRAKSELVFILLGKCCQLHFYFKSVSALEMVTQVIRIFTNLSYVPTGGNVLFFPSKTVDQSATC